MQNQIYLLDRQSGNLHLISKKYTDIGRARGDIPLSGNPEHAEKVSHVSRVHCQLIRHDLEEAVIDINAEQEILFALGVVDLGSQNGTYANDKRVYTLEVPLNDGDFLFLADYQYKVIIQNSKSITEPVTGLQTTKISV
jgi:pSer/pThr/pTyr-binding forkhead associated (FHA) protein